MLNTMSYHARTVSERKTPPQGLHAMPSTKAKRSIYGVHPGVALMQKWAADLPENTGRSLEEWLTFVKKNGPADEVARRDWLKKEHGLGTNAAWWIAERAAGKGWEDSDPESYLELAEQWVEAMFEGNKAGLRPLYDHLLKTCLSLAKDLMACPCKTIVPIYRNHVIAQLKPSTRTRLDFGLALQDTKAPPRLIDTGGFAKKDRITHRIPLSSIDEVDAEVKHWLKVAYDMDGE